MSVSVGVSAGGGAQQPAARPAAAPAEYHTLITKYCVTCHNERLKTPADNPLLLDKVNLDNPGADPAVWEKVVRKLGVGSMPPQGSPRPDAQETARLRTWLATSLDAAAERNDNAGRVALHRL